MDSEHSKELQCSGKHERYGEKDIKRKRVDYSEDEVQQFFALVNRIQAMNEQLKQKKINSGSADLVSSVKANVGAWKPSFEPQDFSYLYSNFHPSVERDSTSVMGNSENTSGSSKQLFGGTGTDKSMATEKFDLNVEPAS